MLGFQPSEGERDDSPGQDLPNRRKRHQSVRRLVKAPAGIRELRDMNSGDFARMARDLCISPAELEAVVRRGPHASDESPRLLKSLDIDEATLSRTQPVLQRDMIRVCAACQQKALCNHDYDAGTLAQRYEEYCLNAPAIDELGQKS